MDGDPSASLPGQLVEVVLDHLGEFIISNDAYGRLHSVNPVRTRDPSVSDGFGGGDIQAGEAPGEDNEPVERGIAFGGEQPATCENDLWMGSRMKCHGLCFSEIWL